RNEIFTDFGWHRVFIRTIVILTVLFVAETVPKFGPILNVIGGSTAALTSAILPLLYNNYLNASSTATKFKKQAID
ncbi:unnamed protein product, partial [Onchocerca ochengi]|uniref:Aa_trans domain-containing protein n=1 Tax=Onchocerca ochengi TaxID=42157 RepID=A0A182EYD1_ONCOC